MKAWLAVALTLSLSLTAATGCAPPEMPLPDPEPGIADLSLTGLEPRMIVPGTELLLTGAGLPSPGDGAISLLLEGQVRGERELPRKFAVRLRAEYVNATTARVRTTSELLGALGVSAGKVDCNASLVIDSAIDFLSHRTTAIRVELQVRQTLVPRLDTVELVSAPRGTDKVHPNDWILVRGEQLLLGSSEGQTTAVLDGCFLPEGVVDTCARAGVLVRGVEVPVRAIEGSDRKAGIFPYTPALHGIRPGRFQGTVALKNQQKGAAVPTRSDPRPLTITQVRPELSGLTPSAASLGQYVELRGAGFVGSAPGQATVMRLVGQFTLEDSPIQIPVDIEVVVEWVPRYPDGPVARYVLDETDALGQALIPRGGLRAAAGTFVGTAATTLRNGLESVSSAPTRVTLDLLHVRQLVLLHFLPSYQESLRLFGLRSVDNAVRARILDVARRDYAGVNIEFREVPPGAPPPTDFALYSEVEIGGSDPNGLGYLGYDNTPGRDTQNKRLYDRIGGVNAVTQNDGAPGYGGVFSEQLLGFSAHPGHVEKIKAPPMDSELFDQIFDPVRPDTGGTPASAAEAAQIPALTTASFCPAPARDRAYQISCAIFVLGSLIGTTMTHELGHSLGLANPQNPRGSYHNSGSIAGRIMNAGSLRSFRERAELSPGGPAVFCETDYQYLRRILPGARTPPPTLERPPCLD